MKIKNDIKIRFRGKKLKKKTRIQNKIYSNKKD